MVKIIMVLGDNERRVERLRTAPSPILGVLILSVLFAHIPQYRSAVFRLESRVIIATREEVPAAYASLTTASSPLAILFNPSINPQVCDLTQNDCTFNRIKGSLVDDSRKSVRPVFNHDRSILCSKFANNWIFRFKTTYNSSFYEFVQLYDDRKDIGTTMTVILNIFTRPFTNHILLLCNDNVYMFDTTNTAYYTALNPRGRYSLSAIDSSDKMYVAGNSANLLVYAGGGGFNEIGVFTTFQPKTSSRGILVSPNGGVVLDYAYSATMPALSSLTKIDPSTTNFALTSAVLLSESDTSGTATYNMRWIGNSDYIIIGFARTLRIYQSFSSSLSTAPVMMESSLEQPLGFDYGPLCMSDTPYTPAGTSNQWWFTHCAISEEPITYYYRLSLTLVKCNVDMCESCPGGKEALTRCNKCGQSLDLNKVKITSSVGGKIVDSCIPEVFIPVGYGRDRTSNIATTKHCEKSTCSYCLDNYQTCSDSLPPLSLTSAIYYRLSRIAVISFSQDIIRPFPMDTLTITIRGKESEDPFLCSPDNCKIGFYENSLFIGLVNVPNIIMRGVLKISLPAINSTSPFRAAQGGKFFSSLLFPSQWRKYLSYLRIPKNSLSLPTILARLPTGYCPMPDPYYL